MNLRTLSLLFALASIVPVGCSRQEAEAMRSERTDSMPAPILELPGQPFALAYLRSPQQLGKEWLQAARQRLGDDSQLYPLLERCLRSDGSTPLVGWDGTTVVGIYPPGDGVGDPDVLVRVMTDTASDLDRWVADLFPAATAATRQVAGVSLKVTPGGGQDWFHGTWQDQWVLTNKPSLLSEKPGLAKSLAPVLEECWNLSGEGKLDAFLGLDLALLRAQAPGFVGSQLEALGLDKTDMLVMSFARNKGRCFDRLFLHTPAPHRGLLSLAGRDTVSDKILTQVADESIAFSVMPLDLAGLWDQLEGMIPPPAAQQLKALEQNLGFWLRRDLLGSLGKQWVSNTFPHSDSPLGMASVMQIPVEDAAKLRTCLDTLLAKARGLEWKPGPEGTHLLSIPLPGGQPAPVLVAGKGKTWYLASSQGAFDLWRSDRIHKGGHSGPRDLFKRFGRRATWLVWNSRQTLTRAQGALSEFAGMTEHMQGPAASIAAMLPMEALARESDRFVGDTLMAVVPGPKGILAEFESDCGLFPVVMAAASGALVLKDQQRELTNLHEVDRQVAEAQQRFELLRGRVARNLWELQDAELLDARISSGVTEGHVFRIVSERDLWYLEFRRDSDRAVFRIVNEAGFLRRIDS